MRATFFACLAIGLLGCGGPSHVTFDHEQCLVDGQVATVEQVEQAQATIAKRVIDRQPLYVIVTLAVILLAGASHIEKLVLLFSTRRQEAKGLAERLTAMLDRYRVHPVRYFSLVAVALALLGVAGGMYLWLDADKRASERALGQLQFCHLALRSADAESTLAEQRRNLDALQATTGDIKSLVNSLPPAEQKKAEMLLEKMRASLGNQDRLMAREAAVAAAVQARSDEIQKGLGVLTVGVSGLKPLPDQIHELDTVARRIEKSVGDTRKDLGDRVAKIDCASTKLPSGKTVGETLAELASRPPPPPPVCKCEFPSEKPPAARDGGAR